MLPEVKFKTGDDAVKWCRRAIEFVNIVHGASIAGTDKKAKQGDAAALAAYHAHVKMYGGPYNLENREEVVIPILLSKIEDWVIREDMRTADALDVGAAPGTTFKAAEDCTIPEWLRGFARRNPKRTSRVAAAHDLSPVVLGMRKKDCTSVEMFDRWHRKVTQKFDERDEHVLEAEKGIMVIKLLPRELNDKLIYDKRGDERDDSKLSFTSLQQELYKLCSPSPTMQEVHDIARPLVEKIIGEMNVVGCKSYFPRRTSKPGKGRNKKKSAYSEDEEDSEDDTEESEDSEEDSDDSDDSDGGVHAVKSKAKNRRVREKERAAERRGKEEKARSRKTNETKRERRVAEALEEERKRRAAAEEASRKDREEVARLTEEKTQRAKKEEEDKAAALELEAAQEAEGERERRREKEDMARMLHEAQMRRDKMTLAALNSPPPVLAVQEAGGVYAAQQWSGGGGGGWDQGGGQGGAYQGGSQGGAYGGGKQGWQGGGKGGQGGKSGGKGYGGYGKGGGKGGKSRKGAERNPRDREGQVPGSTDYSGCGTCWDWAQLTRKDHNMRECRRYWDCILHGNPDGYVWAPEPDGVGMYWRDRDYCQPPTEAEKAHWLECIKGHTVYQVHEEHSGESGEGEGREKPERPFCPPCPKVLSATPQATATSKEEIEDGGDTGEPHPEPFTSTEPPLTGRCEGVASMFALALAVVVAIVAMLSRAVQTWELESSTGENQNSGGGMAAAGCAILVVTGVGFGLYPGDSSRHPERDRDHQGSKQTQGSDERQTAEGGEAAQSKRGGGEQGDVRDGSTEKLEGESERSESTEKLEERDSDKRDREEGSVKIRDGGVVSERTGGEGGRVILSVREESSEGEENETEAREVAEQAGGAGREEQSAAQWAARVTLPRPLAQRRVRFELPAPRAPRQAGGESTLAMSIGSDATRSRVHSTREAGVKPELMSVVTDDEGSAREAVSKGEGPAVASSDGDDVGQIWVECPHGAVRVAGVGEKPESMQAIDRCDHEGCLASAMLWHADHLRTVQTWKLAAEQTEATVSTESAREPQLVLEYVCFAADEGDEQVWVGCPHGVVRVAGAGLKPECMQERDRCIQSGCLEASLLWWSENKKAIRARNRAVPELEQTVTGLQGSVTGTWERLEQCERIIRALTQGLELELALTPHAARGRRQDVCEAVKALLQSVSLTDATDMSRDSDRALAECNSCREQYRKLGEAARACARVERTAVQAWWQASRKPAMVAGALAATRTDEDVRRRVLAKVEAAARALTKAQMQRILQARRRVMQVMRAWARIGRRGAQSIRQRKETRDHKTRQLVLRGMLSGVMELVNCGARPGSPSMSTGCWQAQAMLKEWSVKAKTAACVRAADKARALRRRQDRKRAWRKRRQEDISQDIDEKATRDMLVRTGEALAADQQAEVERWMPTATPTMWRRHRAKVQGIAVGHGAVRRRTRTKGSPRGLRSRADTTRTSAHGRLQATMHQERRRSQVQEERRVSMSARQWCATVATMSVLTAMVASSSCCLTGAALMGCETLPFAMGAASAWTALTAGTRKWARCRARSQSARRVSQHTDKVRGIRHAYRSAGLNVRAQVRGAVARSVQRRREDEGGVASAEGVWEKKRFSSAKVTMTLIQQGEESTQTVIADTGAATELIAEAKLTRATRRQCRRSESRTLRDASGAPMDSSGGVALQFRLANCPYVFHHSFQCMHNSRTPTILGTEFWARHEATFDFRDRMIGLTVQGERHQIPFTVDNTPVVPSYVNLVAQEDTLIGAECLGYVRTTPSGWDEEDWNCGHVWEVHDQEHLSADREDADDGLTEDGYVADQDHGDEAVVCAAVDRPRWLQGDSRPHVPVRLLGGAMPRLVRKGEVIARGKRVAAEEVMFVSKEAQTKDLVTGFDVPEGDWRHGMTARQLVDVVLTDPCRKPAFEAWKEQEAGNLHVGDEGAALTQSQKQDYEVLAFIFKDVIAENPKAPGQVKGIVHRIDFDESKDTTPWQEYIRTGSPAEEALKEQEEEEMLRNGIVEPGFGPFANNIVMVKKQDGTPRFCIDFRRLNDISRRDAFPLARIDDVLDCVGRSKIFSVMDCASAFWSIAVHPEHKERTAFISKRYGLLQFVRMPFGLKNATATYSRAMTHVLRGLLWRQVVMYVDDACVLGESHEDHLEGLKAVLTRFLINGVSVKLSKCKFGITKVEYVGHVAQAGKGVGVNPKKVEAILGMRDPQSASEIASVLGAAGYYQKFIRGFADIVRPLRRLQQETKDWHTADRFQQLWGPEHDESMAILKAALSASPLLISPVFDGRPFLVISDSSDYGIGACLAQYDDEGIERPVMYLSRDLTATEKKYHITDKEGLAATWGIRKWRHLLHGSPVVLITDHSALCALTNKRNLTQARQRRYAMDLMEFDLTIIHRAGRYLHLPDMVSRLGYSQATAQTMVEWMRDRMLHPGEGSPELLGQGAWDQPTDSSWLRARVEAASGGMAGSDEERTAAQSSGAEVAGVMTVKELCRKLQSDGVTYGLIAPEDQAPEESRALEMYEVVSRRMGTQAASRVAVAADAEMVAVSTRGQTARQQQNQPRAKPTAAEEEDDDSSSDSEGESGDDSDGSAESGTGKVTSQGKQSASANNEKTEGKQDEVIISAEVRALMGGIPAVKEIHAAQRALHSMGNIIRYLESGTLPASRIERLRVLESQDQYQMNAEGLLCKVRDRSAARGRLELKLAVLVPEEYRARLIEAYHEGKTAHPGALRTFQRLKEGWHWPGMLTDVRLYVRYCPRCQYNRKLRSKTPVKKHIQASEPGQVWVVDLMRMPKSEAKYEYVLVCVDAFSRYAEVAALKDRKAATVADALAQEVFTSTGGLPELIISDQGSEFKGVFSELCAQLSVRHEYTASHKAAAHGMVERLNRTLKDRMLRLQTSAKRWDRRLGWAKLAYNTDPHVALSAKGETLTPAEVHLGRRLVTVAQMRSAGDGNNQASVSKYVAKMMDDMRAMFSWVKELRSEYELTMERDNPGHGVQGRSFKVGALVWIKKKEPGAGKVREKVELENQGPFKVLAQVGPQEYRVQRVGERVSVRMKVHVDNIGEWYEEATLPGAEEVEGLRAPPATGEGTQVKLYEVERIVDVKGSTAGGDRRYLVKWVGYGENENWWLNENDLQHCSRLIEEFNLRGSGVHVIMDSDTQAGQRLTWRQGVELPAALNEIRESGQKQSHWAWWAFPTSQSGRNEPGQGTWVTAQTAAEIAWRAPDVWRQVLESLCGSAEARGGIWEVVPRSDVGRIRNFVQWWKQQDRSVAPGWLWSVIRRIEVQLDDGTAEPYRGVATEQEVIHNVGEDSKWRADKENSTYVKMDLLQLGEQTGAEAFEKLCEAAGIDLDDAVFVWASPPCETYSRANWSNLSRGFHYRQLLLGHPPRQDGSKYAKMAEAHDRLTQLLMRIVDHVGKGALENPTGGMAHQRFMLKWNADKKTVHLCAYGWPYHKGTDVWTKGVNWTPEGNTGDGRCGGKCGQGEISKVSGRYVHHQAHGVHPSRGARGAGAKAEKHGMPPELLREILRAAELPQNSTVLDLCAGHGSMREVALGEGYRYVAVDIQDERFHGEAVVSDGATCIVSGDEVLVARGPAGVWLPRAKRSAEDLSVHAAAMRAVRMTWGWSDEVIQEERNDVPVVVSGASARYFIYVFDQKPDASQEREWQGWDVSYGREWLKWNEIGDALWVNEEDRTLVEQLSKHLKRSRVAPVS